MNVATLKKIFYITDQDEYMDHGFIAPLLERYFKKYFTVDIVYFTEFKSDFGRKDVHRFTAPERYKNVLLDELKRNDVVVFNFCMIADFICFDYKLQKIKKQQKELF